MKKMKLGALVVGPVSTNCYLAMNEETEEILIIDPGDGPGRIARAAEEMGGKPSAILLTHGHYDHILGIKGLKERYTDIPVLALADEAPMLEDPKINMSAKINRPVSIKADLLLERDSFFEKASFRIQCIYTPGHTPGGCCYYFPEEGVLFSGDTLFRGSIGRTDFEGGSMPLILNSLHRLLELPPQTAVYPGHDDFTTIQREKEYNPFVREFE